MADHTIETIIRLRYDTYMNWMNSHIILQKGEVAICAFSSNESQPPTIGIKVGDGLHYFYELNWIQGLAADVYNWAKQSTPPSADAIPGLAEYIEAHTGTGGSGSTSSAYRIIYDNINNKYILQSYDEETEEWINTSSEINLSSILDRLNGIERWANGEFYNLGNINNPIALQIQEIVNVILKNLNVNDTPQNGYFVTAVSQETGKIRVTKKELKANDITGGVFTTAQGGTGFSNVDIDEILVGSPSGNLIKTGITRRLNDSEDSYNIPTNGAVVDYVNQMTQGLTGAMHYIGDAITYPPDSNSAGIANYTPNAGDVVLWDNKEYVWTGGYWRLLGDEGSYAIKGSIKDADIDAEAEISQSKIANLTETFNSKVDKIDGKGLSTNDYTTEEKNKLRNIEDNAQKNIIERILLNGNELTSTSKTVEININEFSSEDQIKLNNIEDNAQANIIESISLNSVTQTIDEQKNVNLIINEFTSEHQHKLESIEEGAQINIIDSIVVNNITATPVNKQIFINIREYPQEAEEKLTSIEAGAEVNKIQQIIFNGTTAIPDTAGIVSINQDNHTEHINKIESIVINGTEYPPDQNKQVNITIDQAALNLNVLEGAIIPYGASTTPVPISNKKLELARIAATGNVQDLIQTQDTYIILDCGSSTAVID